MKNAANFFIVAISVILTLIYGKSLLLPFVLAFLLWFLTLEFRKLLDKVPPIKKYFPSWLKSLVVFCLMGMILGEVIEILIHNTNTLANSYEQYAPNVEMVNEKVERMTSINIQQSINQALGDFDFTNILRSLLNGLSGLLGNTFMILIYALFLFLEESSFKSKIDKLFSSKEKHQQFDKVVNRIETSVFDYLRLKTMVSFLTGLLSYIVMAFVGIDTPIFWAFLIFLLNYIPTVGSLIATIFPAAFSLIQFGELTPFLIILVALGVVQVIVGNIIEPRVMGRSLNISPLVTIIALAVWGKLWGITGMLLSVPITVVMIIVLSQFDKTKPIAIMLTENGEIE